MVENHRRGTNMRTLLTFAIAMAFLMAAGCDSAKSPDTVEKKVAAAEQKAATEVANSEKAAEKDLNKAADKVDDKLLAFNNAAAQDAYNLVVAKADGDRKIALANCLSVGGDAQKASKDQAEAAFGAAKANPKAAGQSSKAVKECLVRLGGRAAAAGADRPSRLTLASARAEFP